MPDLKKKFNLEERILKKEDLHLVFPQKLVLTRTTQENLEKLLYPILEGRNLLLVGDAGIGKNALIYYINQLRNQPTIRFSFNQDTLPEDLVGSFRVLPNGFVWQNGPLVEAMTKGYTFVADELNLAAPEILKRFTSVLERSQLGLLEKDGSTLKAENLFNLVATQNPSRGFEGRKPLPESISRLFTTIYLQPYALEEQVEIIAGLFPEVPSELVSIITNFQLSLEQLLWSGELANDELEHFHFNLRTSQRFWSRALGMGLELSLNGELLKQILHFYILPFKSQDDRQKAAQLFYEDHPNVGHALKKEWQSMNDDDPILFSINTGQPVQQEANYSDPYPLTKQRMKELAFMQLAIDAGEHLLLEGSESARVHELVHSLAQLNRATQQVISLSKGMHTSEIIGALRPVLDKEASADVPVKWVDGPLTEAIRNGHWVILENVEAAGSELIEKLNMLLDDAGALVLPPEAAEPEPIKLKSGSRIIAVKRHRRSRSQNTISRAFRNRFFSMQIEAMHAHDEFYQSALLCYENLLLDSDELEEHDPEAILIDKFTLYHTKINTAADDRKIGAKLSEPIRFSEENLLRWLIHTVRWLGTEANKTLADSIASGLEIHYISSIPDDNDRKYARELWRRLEADLPINDLESEIQQRKKKLLKQSDNIPKVNWDQKKHFRAAKDRAKPRLGGRNLKKGKRIDTPPTGGNIKEGADAWYGSETQGNMGMGEPAGGGGAWGFRTEELFQAFLKKYKPKWQYHMGYSVQDFYSTFGKLLQQLEMKLESALESTLEVERKLASFGHRVDSRKYVSYMAHHGSDRIFDRTQIHHSDEKLKGLEVVFMIAKGRRQFNFESSIAAVVALQSMVEILTAQKIPIKVKGYSDLENYKRTLDLVEQGDFFEKAETKQLEDLFETLVDRWSGDTVAEADVFPYLSELFSPDATTKLVVFVSDFRGHRAKANLKEELRSYDSQRLHAVNKSFTEQGYTFLAVQTGSRHLAEHLFDHSVWIQDHNIEDAPHQLLDSLEKLILKYHKPAI